VARAARSPSLREILKLENEWAARVEEAKWRLAFAQAHLDELLRNNDPLNAERIATARHITAAFKREYIRVLKAFSDLIIFGAAPRIRWR
jgi:hypothetical protein